MKHFIISGFIIVFYKMTLFAQTPELITDRPDMTESASAVNQGFLQIEMGGVYEYHEERLLKFENYQFANALVRYGIMKNTELRIGSGYLEETSEPVSAAEIQNQLTNTNTGLAPLQLGFKTVLNQEQGNNPQVAVIYAITANNLASPDFRSDGFDFEVIFAADKSLSDKLSIGINVGGRYNRQASQTEGLFSAAAGYDVSSKVGLFAEYFQTMVKDVESEKLINAGFTWLVEPSLQLDVSGGYHLHGEQGYYIKLGFSYLTNKLF